MSGYLKEINIKTDMPTADSAIKLIILNINNSKKLGAGAIKIIHGYGSSGKGGKIRVAARRYLETQKRSGAIRDYIAGEDFTIFNKSTLCAFSACEDLRLDKDLERHNNGITIIIL